MTCCGIEFVDLGDVKTANKRLATPRAQAGIAVDGLLAKANQIDVTQLPDRLRENVRGRQRIAAFEGRI
jgi:hypothetical protein